ncbi:MAG: (2Fe-2S)-binding protein [Spirochaetaceae bacterium]|nr:MAG: (2Fe-2S)-binding protein [Spirochaetaceae bacterium]
MSEQNDKGVYDIRITVNDREITGRVKAETSLLDFLRDNHFMEVKRGCDKGDCGACTVIKDGRAILSCITLALQADGSKVYTVKSLGSWEGMHPLQQAFVDYEALQCGFCTPGMLMSAKALLDANPKPTREEIREAISGNLCRCTGYQKIVDAVEAVVKGEYR